MGPMSSPVRDNRVLGLAEVGMGFLFAIVAALLNPIEAAVGVVLMTPIMAAGTYLGAFRRGARRAVAQAAPAPTEEREEPGALARRMAWPVGGQFVVSLAFAGVARAPGLMAGVAFGIGLALLQTSRLLESWEVGHGAVLLRAPETGRYYVARET
jgi:hypothetical protein